MLSPILVGPRGNYVQSFGSSGAGHEDRRRRNLSGLAGARRKRSRCSVRRKPCPRSLLHQAVSFGERLAGSQAFADLFRDGMALVEETASYLDGPGRQDSKKLERSSALAYATESMRLTTRLMQLASWLLLHRAVKEGEMSLAQANKEKIEGQAVDRRSRRRAQSPAAAGTPAGVDPAFQGIATFGASARCDDSRGSRARRSW